MANPKTEFDAYVQEDLGKQKGIFHPVKAGMLERMMVKNVAITSLHPNEEDEFTFPDVGPSYRIISEYEQQFRRALDTNQQVFDEPLIVEKLRPQGYLILNGHHRWAAAMKVGIKKIPVRIVNLAQESDVQKMLEASAHDKRVALDLDEVVFRPSDDPYLERELRFPYNIKHKQRIRLGIPALFYFLAKNGYDVWTYASNYYSIDDIKHFFKCYGVDVVGIITGTAKPIKNKSENAVKMETLINNRYAETLHIDNDMILVTHRGSKEFEEYSLEATPEKWSKHAISVIKKIGKHEKEK